MPNSVPMRRIRSSISVRCIGSSPSVGSSRRTSSRIVRDRGGELHALPLPRGHRPDRTEALLAEADQPERVVRALHGRAAREQVHLREVPDEVGRRELRRKVVVLGRVADARPHLDPGRRRILAEHGQLAGVAGAEPEDRAR